MVPAETLKRGDTPDIPGYRIEGVVGRGATGVVYRAVQLAFDRTVALKVLHPELVGRGRAIRRMQREARLAARLSHPNLVASIDMGESGGRWWYAMELVEGPSLHHLLERDGPLDERRALRLFIPLADVLVHLADAGVVHRDVKPDNVLVDGRGRPHLIDLGLAFADGDPTMTNPGGTLGTPHYVSPEQARDPTAADARSDVWSFGATMYHALCGRPPFTGDSVAEILSGVLYADVTDPRELAPQASKGIALVLRKCLTRDPARRYAHPSELFDDLERLRERRSVRVQKSSLDPVAGRRSPLQAAAWAVGLLAVVAAALLVLRPGREADDGAGAADAAGAWPPLEEIDADLRGGRTKLGEALLAVEDLAPVLPSEHDEAWERQRAALRASVEREVARALSGCVAGVAEALARRDYVRARDLVDGLAGRVAADLGLDAGQLEEARAATGWRARLADATGSIDAALAQEVERVVASTPLRFAETVGAEVRGRRSEGRWRAARDSLATDRAAWAAEHLDLDALPEADRGPVEAAVAATFDGAARALDLEWEAFDEALAGWVAREGARLAEEVESGAFAGDPVAELSARFERRLLAVGTRPEETLDDVSRRGRNALAAEREALGRRVADLARRDAEAWLEESTAEADALMEARRYAEAARFWERGAALSFVGPVRDRIDLRHREAVLLERWLAAAAGRVVELRGRDVELWHGGVLAAGTLRTSGDPRVAGLTLEPPSGRPIRFLLVPAADLEAAGARVLGAPGFDRLAELAPAAADASPERRLARALFLLREGQVEEADRAAAGLGAVGADDAALRDELRERIAALRAVDAAALERDRERARQLVRTLARLEDSGHAQDRRQALAILDELLGALLHTDEVQARKRDLRALRQRLEAPPPRDLEAEIRRAFAPTAVALDDAIDRAVLTFDFSQSGFRRNEVVGAWTRPAAWGTDVYGWSAGARAERTALLDATAWPRLVLSDPLVVHGSGVSRASLRVRQLDGSGTPTLTVVTFAGWHVALAGGGSPGHEEQPRWYAATGGEDALSDLLARVDAADGRPFPGLERGRTYRLDLVLSQTRGHLRLQIAEVDVGGPTEAETPRFDDRVAQVAPGREEPGTRSLVLRSVEPVRLERVELEADVE